MEFEVFVLGPQLGNFIRVKERASSSNPEFFVSEGVATMGRGGVEERGVY